MRVAVRCTKEPLDLSRWRVVKLDPTDRNPSPQIIIPASADYPQSTKKAIWKTYWRKVFKEHNGKEEIPVFTEIVALGMQKMGNGIGFLVISGALGLATLVFTRVTNRRLDIHEAKYSAISTTEVSKEEENEKLAGLMNEILSSHRVKKFYLELKDDAEMEKKETPRAGN